MEPHLEIRYRRARLRPLWPPPGIATRRPPGDLPFLTDCGALYSETTGNGDTAVAGVSQRTHSTRNRTGHHQQRGGTARGPGRQTLPDHRPGPQQVVPLGEVISTFFFRQS